MKQRAIIGIALIMAAAACSSISYQPFTAVKFQRTERVELFTTKMPERDYVEIGRITVEEDAFKGEAGMIPDAIQKAKEIGADGLIWQKEGSSGLYAVPIGKTWVVGDSKTITFIAIRYK
jgi:hypothetical protein